MRLSHLDGDGRDRNRILRQSSIVFRQGNASANGELLLRTGLQNQKEFCQGTIGIQCNCHLILDPLAFSIDINLRNV